MIPIRKVDYLQVKEITKKWTMPVRDWGLLTARSWYSLQTGLLLEGRSTCRWIRGLCPRTPEVYPFRHSGEMETRQAIVARRFTVLQHIVGALLSVALFMLHIYYRLYFRRLFHLHCSFSLVPRKPNFICSSRWRIWFWLTGVACWSDSGALRGLLTVLS